MRCLLFFNSSARLLRDTQNHLGSTIQLHIMLLRSDCGIRLGVCAQGDPRHANYALSIEGNARVRRNRACFGRWPTDA